MWRYTAVVVLIGSLVGCVSVDNGPETGGRKPYWRPGPGPTVPGVQGPYGQPVPMAAPYAYHPPASEFQARRMMNDSIPLSATQMGNPFPGGGLPGGSMPPTAVPPGGILMPRGLPMGSGGPGGLPMGPGGPGVLTQAGFSQQAGGSGVIPANIPPGGMPPGGVVQAQVMAAPTGIRFPAHRTQVRFGRPTGMEISFYTVGPDGRVAYSSTPLFTPVKYNFNQAAIYRLRLDKIEGHPGLPLYPTLEVVPSNPKTDSFLAHNSVPVDFTPEDIKQVVDGNYIVKVIYLPDPQFQDGAGPGVEEILSTRLDPGVDPIQEALRRGSILLVIRMGNIDQEAPNTPSLGAPSPNAPAPMPMPNPGFGGGGGFGFGPGGPGHGPTMPLMQVPYLGMPKQGGAPVGPQVPMVIPPGAMPGPFPGLGAAPPGYLPPGPNGADPRMPVAPANPGAPFKAPSFPLTPPGAPGTPPPASGSTFPTAPVAPPSVFTSPPSGAPTAPITPPPAAGAPGVERFPAPLPPGPAPAAPTTTDPQPPADVPVTPGARDNSQAATSPVAPASTTPAPMDVPGRDVPSRMPQAPAAPTSSPAVTPAATSPPALPPFPPTE